MSRITKTLIENVVAELESDPRLVARFRALLLLAPAATHGESPEVLTREEAAKLLGVCAKSVGRLARRSGLPAHRIGREWRFRRTELLKWLDSHGANPQ